MRVNAACEDQLFFLAADTIAKANANIRNNFFIFCQRVFCD